jgi:hypothetical protein
MAEKRLMRIISRMLVSTLLLLAISGMIYGAGADITDVSRIVDNTNRVAYYQGADGKAK